MKFLRRFFTWIKVLLGSVGSVIEGCVEPAIQFVQVLKLVVDNPALDFLTALTGTTIDDALLKQLRKYLPEVIIKLQLAKALEGKKEAEKIAAIIELLRKLAPEVRNLYYFKVSSLLTAKLQPDLTEVEADTLVQLAYADLKADDKLINIISQDSPTLIV